MFSMAMWMSRVVAPIQILAGDQHGLNTLEHQPAKVMAMEGHFQSHPDGAPLVLFGWPDRGRQGRCTRSRIPQAVVADPQALARRAAAGPRHGAAQRLAAGADRLLVVPDHGRARLADAAARRCGACSRALRGTALRLALAASLRAGHGAGGLRRGDRRLGDDRGRAPALHGLRPAAHRRLGVAACGAGGRRRRCSPSSSSTSRVRRRHPRTSCS